MISRFYAKYLFPKEMADSVYAVDYDKLWQMGLRGLIFDIDNTLATFDIPTPPPKVVEFLEGLAKKGFGICLLSNNSEARVRGFCAALPYPFIWKAGKPKKKGIRRAAALLSLDETQLALVGDQIFTDCLCGNRFGVYTVLTKPIAKRDEWTVRLKRWPEKIILKAYKKKFKM